MDQPVCLHDLKAEGGHRNPRIIRRKRIAFALLRQSLEEGLQSLEHWHLSEEFQSCLWFQILKGRILHTRVIRRAAEEGLDDLFLSLWLG